jgi:hypothetical protein
MVDMMENFIVLAATIFKPPRPKGSITEEEAQS